MLRADPRVHLSPACGRRWSTCARSRYRGCLAVLVRRWAQPASQRVLRAAGVPHRGRAAPVRADRLPRLTAGRRGRGDRAAGARFGTDPAACGSTCRSARWCGATGRLRRSRRCDDRRDPRLEGRRARDGEPRRRERGAESVRGIERPTWRSRDGSISAPCCETPTSSSPTRAELDARGDPQSVPMISYPFFNDQPGAGRALPRVGAGGAAGGCAARDRDHRGRGGGAGGALRTAEPLRARLAEARGWEMAGDRGQGLRARPHHRAGGA